MLHRPDEFTAFIQEPPTIEITKGVAIVRYRTGGYCLERAMSVGTLAAAVERGRQALDRYTAGERSVIVAD